MERGTEETIKGLRLLFAFGVPGGRSKVQRAIGNYLDGDDALDDMPLVAEYMDEAIRLIRKGREMRSRTYQEYRSRMAIAGVLPLSEEEWTAATARLAPQREPEMVTCGCGHTVPRPQVMSSSRGLVCADCYDEYSE